MERDFILDRFIREQVRLISESDPSCVIVPVSRDRRYLAYTEQGSPLESKAFFCATIGASQEFRLELEPIFSDDGRKLARLPAHISCSQAKPSGKTGAAIQLRVAINGKELEFSADIPSTASGHSLVFSQARGFSISDKAALARLTDLLGDRRISVQQDLHLPELSKICSLESRALLQIGRAS